MVTALSLTQDKPTVTRQVVTVAIATIVAPLSAVAVVPAFQLIVEIVSWLSGDDFGFDFVGRGTIVAGAILFFWSFIATVLIGIWSYLFISRYQPRATLPYLLIGGSCGLAAIVLFNAHDSIFQVLTMLTTGLLVAYVFAKIVATIY
ncbi:MAG: hypothetical protein AAF351_13980 [Pseudomonadota bacterium]